MHKLHTIQYNTIPFAVALAFFTNAYRAAYSSLYQEGKFNYHTTFFCMFCF